jgi:ubiquinone/menaquinone biosynthesis C-methylase UbiE
VTAPSSIGEAYSRTGGAWEAGPGRIYNRLAEIVVAHSPVPLTGRVVLDHGAGTGAASRAIASAGGLPVAADAAWGMLAFDAGPRPPATVADAAALPFADACFGGVVSAFCLNHALDPVPGLREIGRVTASGGAMVVATYAEDDSHPMREALEAALTEAGWVAADWYVEVRNQATAPLARPVLVLSILVLTAVR